MITGWRGKENIFVGMAKPTVNLTASLTRPALVLSAAAWTAQGSMIRILAVSRGPPGTVTARWARGMQAGHHGILRPSHWHDASNRQLPWPGLPDSLRVTAIIEFRFQNCRAHSKFLRQGN